MRRTTLFWAALLGAWGTAPVPAAAQTPAAATPWHGNGIQSAQAARREALPPIATRGVAAVGLTVADMDSSVRFYIDLLTFSRLSDTTLEATSLGQLVGVPHPHVRIVRLRLGDEVLELTQFLGAPARPVPADSRSNDRWFQHVAIIVSDMDRAFAKLEAAGVRHASAGRPAQLPAWNPNAGGIKAFYFRDPDGHPFEILQFPPGKGLAKWHDSHDRLFLGIDHTAIVVRNSERSLAFYRDLLGLSVVGHSENYGPEQEQLNNVPGAHLRITSLRGPDGPGIEFLEYQQPGDGRAYPPDERASDLVHCQTRLVIADAGAAAAKLALTGIPVVSAGAVALAPGIVAEGTRGVQVRDPDRHAVQLIEP